MSEKFQNQVKILLRILPYIAQDSDFGLKGGTAINYFYRDMPRLSVDIDLTYLPLDNRQDTLSHINEKYKAFAKRISETAPDLAPKFIYDSEQRVKRLDIYKGQDFVKIEINHVVRGTIFGAEQKSICQSIQTQFKSFVNMPVVSIGDLYGGKICAALDRQHPRDLFDVKLLFENEGYTPEIHKGFLYFLISHKRPISELVKPNLLNIDSIYYSEFIGMTVETIPLADLYNARDQLLDKIHNNLTNDEKEFLISLKQGEPKWELSGIPNIETYPSVQWKLINIRKIPASRQKPALDDLKRKLSF